MLAWLGAKAFLGVARWAWVLVAVVAVIGVVWALDRAERADDRANQDIGRTVERVENLEETLDRTEQGNEERSAIEAETDIGRGQRLYDQCLRTARTPSNCERFLPQLETD